MAIPTCARDIGANFPDKPEKGLFPDRRSGIRKVVSPGAGGEKKIHTTKFKHPSQDSPVMLLCPETRKVKTECDRDERWFIRVDATERLDCARVSSEAT